MFRSRLTPCIALLVATGLLGITARAFAADGDLDPTFGPGPTPAGSVTTAIGEGATASAVALQSDGKIVVAGISSNSSDPGMFALTRYNANGSLDTSFGGDGIVETNVSVPGPGNSGYDFFNSVLIQPDGRIVAGGLAHDSLGRQDFAIARYNTDGTLDATFNAAGPIPGVVLTAVGDAGVASINGLALQSDGKIVAVGFARFGAATFDVALARYTPLGILEAAVTTPVGAGGDATWQDVLIRSDGTILVAGRARPTAFPDPHGFALVLYNSSLTLDTVDLVGGTGTVITQFPGSASADAASVKLQPDGKIVVGGDVADASDNVFSFALARYTANGSLDTSFNPSGTMPGTQVTPVGDGQAAFPGSVLIQQDGKIVLVGYAEVTAAPTSSFALARYDAAGALDPGFGAGGIVLTPIGNGGDAEGGAATLQPDGKIVAVGYAKDEGKTKVAVARYTVAPADGRPGGGTGNGSGGGGGVSGNPASAYCGALSDRPVC